MDAPTPARRRSVANLALAVVFVALLALAALLALRGSGGLTLSSACGGQPVVHVGGAAQLCTFDDEFDRSRLDTGKWQVLSTPRIGFHTGLECFVDDGKHVAVRGGALALALSYSAPAGACRRLGLGYESGMVTTQGRFAQAYGRFTIRAALPADPGMQPALWLYPQALRYGKWPRSGEIDIAEAFGSAAQTWPHLHYLGADGTQAHPGRACPVPAGGGFHN
jgi:beta-glucanase (GH16 family)